MRSPQPGTAERRSAALKGAVGGRGGTRPHCVGRAQASRGLAEVSGEGAWCRLRRQRGSPGTTAGGLAWRTPQALPLPSAPWSLLAPLSALGQAPPSSPLAGSWQQLSQGGVPASSPFSPCTQLPHDYNASPLAFAAEKPLHRFPNPIMRRPSPPVQAPREGPQAPRPPRGACSSRPRPPAALGPELLSGAHEHTHMDSILLIADPITYRLSCSPKSSSSVRVSTHVFPWSWSQRRGQT